MSYDHYGILTIYFKITILGYSTIMARKKLNYINCIIHLLIVRNSIENLVQQKFFSGQIYILTRQNEHKTKSDQINFCSRVHCFYFVTKSKF